MDDDQRDDRDRDVPADSGDPGPAPLADQVAALAEEVSRRVKGMSRLGKALGQLGREKVLAAPAKVARVLAELHKVRDLPDEILGEDLRASLPDLLVAVGADQAERLAQRRVSFGIDLTTAAGEADLQCRLVTADPMEYALPPFTLGVDLASNRASLRYARLEVAEVAAEPDRILAERAKRLEELEAGWDAEVFFETLLLVYRQRCREPKQPMGTRVALVELLPRLALAFQKKPFWRDPTARNFRDYSRARFAYDLGRLRREGKLCHLDLRLNLGPATGEATRRKGDVLYLEEGPDRGQYYLSAWFVSQETEHHREETP